jgi:hypothetical protein
MANLILMEDYHPIIKTYKVDNITATKEMTEHNNYIPAPHKMFQQ